MDFVSGAVKTGQVPEWSCPACGHWGVLDIVTDSTVSNSILLAMSGRGDSSAQRRAQKLADQRFELAKQLARCPACRHRPRGGPWWWLIAGAMAIGAVVGLIGVLPGAMLSFVVTWPPAWGMLAGWLGVGGVAAAIVCVRRLRDIDRWTKVIEAE